MATILDKIVNQKRLEIQQRRQQVQPREMRVAAEASPKPRDFVAALRAAQGIALIAEVKKASPSQGIIRADFDPVSIAQTYAAHGAHCISVLTDEPFFQGRIEYLEQVREVVDLPLLRKDFILDEYQIFEARAAGADAVLLIAEILTPSQLKEFSDLARSLEMVALIELYEPENLPGVLDSGTPLIGVNNRDLRTFEVDLWHTIRLREKIPRDILLVGESGIHLHSDVELLEQHRVDAILVGESLMRQDNVGKAVEVLLGRVPS